MPNIWTHCLFGEALAGRIGFAGELEQAKELNLYRLGCQGPDFLFFHNFMPWQTKIMDKLGNAMHERECGPFLMAMADRARAAGTGTPLFHYVLGFMTHHVLDRNMHPYIFYRGGYRKWDHQRFEVAMDTLIVRRMRGIDTWRFPVWTLIELGGELPHDITEMLRLTAAELYPKMAVPLTAGHWKQAYRHMVLGHKMFHDPFGIKRILTFGQIAPMVYKRRPPALDFLNEAKREWRHPAVQEEASDASIWEMWDAAMIDGEDMLRAMFAYAGADEADAAEARARLEAVVGNRSYESGKPVEDHLKLQYADPIFG